MVRICIAPCSWAGCNSRLSSRRLYGHTDAARSSALASKDGVRSQALQFHPNGRVAYCVNELKPTVNVLGWDGERGVLTTLQAVSS